MLETRCSWMNMKDEKRETKENRSAVNAAVRKCYASLLTVSRSLVFAVISSSIP